MLASTFGAWVVSEMMGRTVEEHECLGIDLTLLKNKLRRLLSYTGLGWPEQHGSV